MGSGPDSVRKLTVSLKKAKQERKNRRKRAMSGEGIGRPSLGAGRVSDGPILSSINGSELKEKTSPSPGKVKQTTTTSEISTEEENADATETVEKDFLSSLFSGMTDETASSPISPAHSEAPSNVKENNKPTFHGSLLSPLESA
eukprot:8767683-Ditylum_brightwellii.AAC.1